MTRDQELWGMALWLEKNHGRDGSTYIGEQVTRLARSGDDQGIRMWRSVAERYDRLIEQQSFN